eukprot:9773640-Prorocentrum_lima.AAC.1
MTSSLVGSEMCIRDRTKYVLGCGKSVESSEANEIADEVETQARIQIKHCLLYTSDAADDM